MKTLSWLGSLLVFVVLVAASGGCATKYNDRHTIGNAVRVPAVAMEPAALGRADVGMAEMGVSVRDTTRTTRLDRGDWDALFFTVPVDGTVHTPTWSTVSVRADTGTPRREGLYPTAETSLELGTDSDVLFWEFLLSAPLAFVDLFFVPVRMLTDPAWVIEQSPKRLWKRTPQRDDGGTWYAGALPAEDGEP